MCSLDRAEGHRLKEKQTSNVNGCENPSKLFSKKLEHLLALPELSHQQKQMIKASKQEEFAAQKSCFLRDQQAEALKISPSERFKVWCSKVLGRK